MLKTNLLSQRCNACWIARRDRPKEATYSRHFRTFAQSNAQIELQDALRKSQDAAQVLQLVKEQKQHLNCTLASTAVQKLVLLPTGYLSTEELTTVVEQLANVATNDLAAVADPTTTLWGFAELNIQCDAVQELLETFAERCWKQQQHSGNNINTSSQQTDAWNTVAWAYADNSDQACKNLATTAWAFGRLTVYPSPPIVDCMSSIAAELSKKLHNNNLKAAFSPDDLADIVDAYASFLEQKQGGQPGWAHSFSRRSGLPCLPALHCMLEDSVTATPGPVHHHVS